MNFRLTLAVYGGFSPYFYCFLFYYYLFLTRLEVSKEIFVSS